MNTEEGDSLNKTLSNYSFVVYIYFTLTFFTAYENIFSQEFSFMKY